MIEYTFEDFLHYWFNSFCKKRNNERKKENNASEKENNK